MAAGTCEHCGGQYKNLNVHLRFCKNDPANKKETAEPPEPETEGIEELGDLTAEDIQEPIEPPQDHMFRVEFGHLDPFGYPYRSITQARLENLEDAVYQADIQTDIVTLSMKTTPYGPCSIMIPKEDVDNGIRSLGAFVGNKIFLVKTNSKEYYEILMMRSEIRKMYQNIHSIPTQDGKARWEDIQRNALAISPEGTPTAPPPIMYPNQYKNNSSKYTQTIQKAANAMEKE